MGQTINFNFKFKSLVTNYKTNLLFRFTLQYFYNSLVSMEWITIGKWAHYSCNYWGKMNMGYAFYLLMLRINGYIVSR